MQGVAEVPDEAIPSIWLSQRPLCNILYLLQPLLEPDLGHVPARSAAAAEEIGLIAARQVVAGPCSVGGWRGSRSFAPWRRSGHFPDGFAGQPGDELGGFGVGEDAGDEVGVLVVAGQDEVLEPAVEDVAEVLLGVDLGGGGDGVVFGGELQGLLDPEFVGVGEDAAEPLVEALGSVRSTV